MARPQCDNTPLVLRIPCIKGHYLAYITSIILLFNTYFSVIPVEYHGEKLEKKWWGSLGKQRACHFAKHFIF
jgi:hypothetical protein